MSEKFARYLTVLIAKDLEHHKDISSTTCEMIEKRLINNKFNEVENYIHNFLKDTSTISEIVERSDT